MSAGEPPSRLLLVGMMGTGKTTVGRMVADRLGWRFCDSDAQVEAATGRTVPEILATYGEVAFRAEESKALREALSDEKPVVVAVAGGAVLDPANRALIRASGKVVWLRSQPATLAVRVGTGAGRPLLGDDPPRALVKLSEVRRPFYEEIANTVIDVDNVNPAEVAARLAALMTGPAAPSGGARP